MWNRNRKRGRYDRADNEPVILEDKPGRVWSPAQIVSFIVGVGAIVFGVLALIETGVDGSLKRPHDELWSFHHTPLLALIEIAFGILLVLAATSATFGRGVMAILGSAAAAFGILVLLDAWPNRLHRWLGVHDRNGWLFVIVGGVVLLSALVLPTIVRPGRRVIQQGDGQRVQPSH
jgi:Domain of unknown function (DUF4383)